MSCQDVPPSPSPRLHAKGRHQACCVHCCASCCIHRHDPAPGCRKGSLTSGRGERGCPQGGHQLSTHQARAVGFSLLGPFLTQPDHDPALFPPPSSLHWPRSCEQSRTVWSAVTGWDTQTLADPRAPMLTTRNGHCTRAWALWVHLPTERPGLCSWLQRSP